jgi:hypothetical protein
VGEARPLTTCGDRNTHFFPHVTIHISQGGN